MKPIYEGTISNYKFVMIDESTIEVWSSFDEQDPETYIIVDSNSIKTEKDFHAEISYWWMNHNY